MTRNTHAPRPTVDRRPGDPLTQMWQTTSRRHPPRHVGPALATWTPKGYDPLTAAEVNEKLAQFSQSELREVR
jgi:hypothetical protein